MEYVYAALILHETDTEINESNLTAVLEAAGKDVTASRVKAIVAALEDVDLAATVASDAAVEEPSVVGTDAGVDVNRSSETQDGTGTDPFDALSGASETESAVENDTNVTADGDGDAADEGDGSKGGTGDSKRDTDDTGA